MTALPSHKSDTPGLVLKVGLVFLALISLVLFLVSLELITYASQAIGIQYSLRLVHITGNATVSFCIGILFTAVIQSSSTLTSTLVAMVASGVITLEAAIPMVLGANIGTTVTPLLVSLANLGSPKAFKRGFMVASSHVIFNVMCALPFLFLEIHDQFLSITSGYLANKIFGLVPWENQWLTVFQELSLPIVSFLQTVVSNQPILILLSSLVLLFMCILTLTASFKWLIFGASGQNVVSKALTRPGISLLSGMGLTALIHSSSVTTSLSVMLAASEKVSPNKLFPYILGANVGTTITALMAAAGRSEAALAIALSHFLFNAIGVVIFFPVPSVRAIPVLIARWSAGLATRYSLFALAYLVLLFFALPVLVLFISGKWGA